MDSKRAPEKTIQPCKIPRFDDLFEHALTLVSKKHCPRKKWPFNNKQARFPSLETLERLSNGYDILMKLADLKDPNHPKNRASEHNRLNKVSQKQEIIDETQTYFLAKINCKINPPLSILNQIAYIALLRIEKKPTIPAIERLGWMIDRHNHPKGLSHTALFAKGSFCNKDEDQEGEEDNTKVITYGPY